MTFSPRRPPDNENAAGKVMGGNPRRARLRSSVGQRRRPPRSFPGGATPLPIREMLPLRERAERGRLQALPKAGVGRQGPQTATETASVYRVGVWDR